MVTTSSLVFGHGSWRVVDHMIGERWGVTDDEVLRRYPCDDIVPFPAAQLWRGVTIQAPPSAVWPWLCQLRLAPYSYDWVDNLGHRSPRELRAMGDPEPGEPFSRLAGKFPVGRVLCVTRQEHLTATVMGAVMSYLLSPGDGSTRLLLKIVFSRRHWYSTAVGVGDWPMARQQLKNFKRLAEAGLPTDSRGEASNRR